MFPKMLNYLEKVLHIVFYLLYFSWYKLSKKPWKIEPSDAKSLFWVLFVLSKLKSAKV